MSPISIVDNYKFNKKNYILLNLQVKEKTIKIQL